MRRQFHVAVQALACFKMSPGASELNEHRVLLNDSNGIPLELTTQLLTLTMVKLFERTRSKAAKCEIQVLNQNSKN